MDIQTLLHNLREEVSCSVCMNTFTDPKQLPCLHSYCLQCLKELLTQSNLQGRLKCPNCQAVSKIPDNGDLSDLPTSYYLNSMLDVLTIKECNTSQVRCGNCDKKTSESFYCFQCCVFWCGDCINGHNIIRSNKGHRVLALKDFQDNDFQDVLSRPAFCQKQRHEKEELKFFCKNCAVAICQTCVLMGHSGHLLEHIEEEADRKRLQIKPLIKTQKQQLQLTIKGISRLEEDYAEVLQQAADVEKDVQRFVDNIIGIIEAKKRAIFTAVAQKTKKSLDRLTEEKEELQHRRNMIESMIEKAEALSTRSTSAEVVLLHKSIETVFEGVGQEAQVNRQVSLQHLAFVENQTILDNLNTEEIGVLELSQTTANESLAEGKGLKVATVGLEAQLAVTTRNSEGRQSYHKRDSVVVEIRNKPEGHDCTAEVRIRHDNKGVYKISYFTKEAGHCDLTVKVNGENVPGSPFTIHVKARAFKPLASYSRQTSSSRNSKFNCPLGVAVNDRDEIALTDIRSDKVQVISSDGKTSRWFGGRGGKEGEFRYPAGIAFDNNGNILVVDSLNSRIQIFNAQGEYVGKFGKKGSLHGHLSSPYGVALDSNGNIIVADTDNKMIKLFSPTGKFLRMIGEDGSLSFPYHCIQHEKYLVLSDSGEHCIKVFDNEGNFLFKFGKKGGGDGEFNYPRCLSVSKSGHLMVCDTSNNRIQLFELNGKFIGKFGTKGNNLGEFNKPTSLAVLSNGRIVVADLCNHRIQIFE